MSRPESEELQLYFSRIRPIYHQLYNLAHVITGSRERAEYALQYAILDCWTVGDADASNHGFREALRSSTIHAALKQPPCTAEELDWSGLAADPRRADALQSAVAQEGPEMQRVLALRCGCRLSPRRIARVMDADVRRIQAMLRRFEARTSRKLPAAQRRRYDLLITRTVRSQLSQPNSAAPEMGRIFRSFQADAASVSRPSRLPARILHAVLAVVMALLCILAFWLTAVLLEPAYIQSPAQAVETIES